jgi:hypothetical protein
LIRIQRVRCTRCHRTTNVLPSFLLAHKSYSIDVLKVLLSAFFYDTINWKKSPHILIDLSTAYRWLRIIELQAKISLPDIRKELLELKPHHHLFNPKTKPLLSRKDILERFITCGEQLLKAAVRHIGNKCLSLSDPYCFLNYFLAKTSGKPLLIQ